MNLAVIPFMSIFRVKECAINRDDAPEDVEKKLAKTESPLLRSSLKRSSGVHVKFTDYFGKYTLSTSKKKPRATLSDSDSDIQVQTGALWLQDNPPPGITQKVAMPRKGLHFARKEDSPIFLTVSHIIVVLPLTFRGPLSLRRALTGPVKL